MNSKRHFKTLLCAAGLLAASLLAACGGSGDQGRDPILGVPAATLVSVVVSPATSTVAIGATQQFSAVAGYTDGSAVDVTAKSSWTSANTAVASVGNTGLATGVSAGTAAISAAFGGKTASGVVTVLPAKLVSIALTPATTALSAGSTQQYVVTGTFDDNSRRDVTAVSTFTIAAPAIASISATGLATAKSAGTTSVVATDGALSASASLTVLPATVASLSLTPAATTFQIGAIRQLSTIATYTDGKVVDVTGVATYNSTTPAAVSVNASGLITGVAAGSSALSASFGGKTATAQATTSAATVSSIAVTPASATVAIGGTQQYLAVATYSDNSTAVVTNSAVWNSSNTAIAAVLNTGLATGVTPGNSTITATAGGKSGTAQITVTATAPPPPPPSAGVNLRSAANFAVLAGTALTSNAGGTTLINGDVGSPSQTVAPTLAPGSTNYQSGAILDTALADLQVAITDANSRSCDVSFAGDIDLGGLTLPPGVYCYAGNISVTGTLTLNGGGVYIFRTALTLNTTANSMVALIGGADAENVSWVPVGATTLGANSVFKGSVLGKSAAITVGDNTTLLNGRVLSGAAVTLSNNQISK